MHSFDGHCRHARAEVPTNLGMMSRSEMTGLWRYFQSTVTTAPRIRLKNNSNIRGLGGQKKIIKVFNFSKIQNHFSFPLRLVVAKHTSLL